MSLGCAVDAWLGLKQALGAPLIVKKAPTLRTQAPALDSRVLFTAVRRTITVAVPFATSVGGQGVCEV